MITLAEVALSGDTQITVALVISLLVAVSAYVAEKVSTRLRLAALERSDEKQLEHSAAISERHQKDRAECQERLTKVERDIYTIKLQMNPPRSGSWPSIQVDDR